MPGYFRGEDPSALNLDLTDTRRSPGLIPQYSPVPTTLKRAVERFTKRTQLPLPAAPAVVPPASAPVSTSAKPFYKMPVVWVGAAAVAFFLFRGKKG